MKNIFYRETDSEYQYLLYDTMNKEYVCDTLGNKFSSEISYAKDFSWMGLLKNLYKHSMNEVYLDRNFVWRKTLKVKWNVGTKTDVR